MTTPQKIGALAAFLAAVVGVYLGNRTVSNPSGTRACITWDRAKPAGLKVTRAVLALSPQAQTTLGLSPVTDWAYAGVEVQAVEGTELPAFASRVLGHVEVVPEAVWDRTAQGAVAPACEVLVVRQDDPAITSAAVFQCGCAVDATCMVGGQPAPRGVTLEPGTFSGNCARKPCVELLGHPSSMPVACR